MKNPNVLRQEASDFEANARAVVNGVEENGIMSEEDAASVKEMLEKADALRAEAKELEDRMALAARARDTANRPKPRESGPVHHRAGPEPVNPVEPSLDVQMGGPRIESDPLQGFESFNEYAYAVRQAFHPSSPRIDERLMSPEAAASGAATYGGEEGGFLIPEGFANDMLTRPAAGLPPILSMVNQYTLKGNSVRVTAEVDDDRSDSGKRHGGIVVYWPGEAKEYTASGPLKSRVVRLELNKLTALSYATEEELTEVANYGQKLLQKMGEAINEEIIYAVNFGTGAGQPLGAFNVNSPAYISIGAEDNQTISNPILYENIVEMYSRMHPGKLSRAIWMYAPNVYPELAFMKVDVGTGGTAVFVPASGAAGAPYGTLQGLPVYPTDHCPVKGTMNDIILAEYSDYLLATKGTPTSAMSVHVRFIYDESVFKMSFKVDGRPGWDAPQTPRNGGPTLSPWVNIETRS